MAFFVDTSALAKLVLDEPETAAMKAWRRGKPLVTSDFALVEFIRVVRKNAPEREPEIAEVMERVEVTGTTPSILATAARLEPRKLKSLDAIHLASVLGLGDNLDGFVTYDHDLAAAATLNGVRVVAPRDRPLAMQAQSLQHEMRVA